MRALGYIIAWAALLCLLSSLVKCTMDNVVDSRIKYIELKQVERSIK